jgi:hypothetical protein
MTKIIQMMPTSYPLKLRFEKFHEPFLIDVEFICLVDYDGVTEMEYAGILDGHMILFNVDGQEVQIERSSPSFMKFNTNFNYQKEKQARESYGL